MSKLLICLLIWLPLFAHARVEPTPKFVVLKRQVDALQKQYHYSIHKVTAVTGTKSIAFKGNSDRREFTLDNGTKVRAADLMNVWFGRDGGVVVESEKLLLQYYMIEWRTYGNENVTIEMSSSAMKELVDFALSSDAKPAHVVRIGDMIIGTTYGAKVLESELRGQTKGLLSYEPARLNHVSGDLGPEQIRIGSIEGTLVYLKVLQNLRRRTACVTALK